MTALWLKRIGLAVVWLVVLLYSVILVQGVFFDPAGPDNVWQLDIVASAGVSFLLSVARRVIDLPSSALSPRLARQVERLLAGRRRYGVFAALAAAWLAMVSVSMVVLPAHGGGGGGDGAMICGLCMISGALFGELLAKLPMYLLDHGRAPNGPDAARIDLRAPSTLARWMPLVAVAVTGATLAWIYWGKGFDLAVALYLPLLWLMFLVLLWAPRAELGADGVYIWGIDRRFVPFLGRETARTRFTGVDIARDGKKLVCLRVLGDQDFARRDLLVDRIRSMLANARARITPANAAIALVERRNATGGETDYRTAGLTRDDLWRVVEAPIAPARARIEAARELALVREQDDAVRFRAAAEAMADPEAREQLLEATVRRSS